MTMWIFLTKTFSVFQDKLLRKYDHQGVTRSWLKLRLFMYYISSNKPILSSILSYTYAWNTVCEIRWRFLGLAFSKKPIHFEKLEKQTNSVDSFPPGTLLPRLNQLQIDVTSGGQIVIWTKLGQMDFSSGHI